MPGGTAAASRRGSALPHRASQTPLSSTSADPVTYYDQPVVKKPVWTWEIPLYFLTGGVAGAAAPLAALSELAGNERLAKRAWALALANIGISPVLLISDLGKPARFFNMLRVFKVTSPMSVGSWILSVAGTSIGLAAVRSWLGWFPRLGAASAAGAAVSGPALASYTAALVAQTAIPTWHDARRELPFVFVGSAAASAGAGAAMLTPGPDGAPARRLGVAGALAEVAASVAMERRLGPLLAEPYRQGRTGRFARAARGLTLAGAAALAAGGRRHRAALAGGALITAGAFCERWAVYRAGFDSAADSRHTVVPQRRRLEERRGHRQSEQPVRA
jgi:hypothetical protein